MIIYKVTNNINGKIYVGKCLTNDPTYFGSGILIKNAIQKYGIENFSKEILEIIEDAAILNDREKYWIKELNSQDRKIGYNIHSGGDGGNTFGGKPHKEESKEKSRESNKKTWSNPELRKKHSEDRKKISHLVRPKVIEWWTPERRKERSELIKTKWTEENRKNVSLKMKDIKKKKVVCDGILYESISDAMETLNLSWYIITKNIKNENLKNWYKI